MGDEHSCEIVSVDENADFQRAINPASNTCIKGQSSWGTPSAGTIKAYEEMRKGAPHIKMLLSVGGWSMSNSFSKCTTDAASRAKIVGSVKKFLQEHDFDGIDYDWEFPGYNRTDGAGIPNFASKWTYDPEHDRDNFMALLAETRTMLGDLQKEKSRSDKYLQSLRLCQDMGNWFGFFLAPGMVSDPAALGDEVRRCCRPALSLERVRVHLYVLRQRRQHQEEGAMAQQQGPRWCHVLGDGRRSVVEPQGCWQPRCPICAQG